MSAVHRSMIVLMSLFIVGCLTAAVLVKVDIYADARARIQPAGRSKVIQPNEAGRVSTIYVQNGSRVHQGAVVLELDATESEADRRAHADELGALDAEIARRKTVARAIIEQRFATELKISFPDQTDLAAQAREESIYRSELAHLQATLGLIDARIAESVAQQRALRATIAAQKELIATLKRRFDMWQAARLRGVGSGLNEIDAEEAFERELTILSTDTGNLLKASAALASSKRERIETAARSAAENNIALVAAQLKRDQVLQALVKSTSEVSHMVITAPVAGTVQELAITTVGQVVAPGQQLMTLVPEGAQLEAEALVANRDIGFVKPHQRVTLQIEAYPFTIYGTLRGTVSRVSRDAVENQDSRSPMSSPAAAGYAVPSSTPRIENQVYPVAIVLESPWLVSGGKRLPLAPGMIADVHITTGERKLIDYLLSQLREVTAEAVHER